MSIHKPPFLYERGYPAIAGGQRNMLGHYLELLKKRARINDTAGNLMAKLGWGQEKSPTVLKFATLPQRTCLDCGLNTLEDVLTHVRDSTFEPDPLDVTGSHAFDVISYQLGLDRALRPSGEWVYFVQALDQPLAMVFVQWFEAGCSVNAYENVYPREQNVKAAFWDGGTFVFTKKF